MTLRTAGNGVTDPTPRTSLPPRRPMPVRILAVTLLAASLEHRGEHRRTQVHCVPLYVTILNERAVQRALREPHEIHALRARFYW